MADFTKRTDRSVEFWKDAIRNAQRFQIQYGDSRSWKQYKDYYRHKFPIGVFPVNQMFSIMRSVVAQTYFRNPTVTVTPTKPGLIYQMHAKTVESIDRYLIRELMVKHEIKKMIQDAFLCGISSGFNGYDSEFGWTPSKSQDGNLSLTQFDKKGYRLEYNSFINPGMPWFLRARPDDVIWPWGTQDRYNAEWVALRVLRPLSDLKKDKKYTVPRDLQGSYVPQRSGPEGEVTSDNYFENMQRQIEWVELWQIHDAKTRKIFVLTMNHDKFLRNDIDEMQIEGLPVETLIFNPDTDYIYGIPDARIIEPQLLELNEIRTQAMKFRRVDIPKLLIKKGAIEAEAITKLLDEDVKAVVEIEMGETLSDVVMPLTPGLSGVMQDMAFAADQVRSDVRETVGFSRINVGEFQGKTHVTASEVQNVMQRGDIRMDERRDAVADLLSNIIRKFNQTIFKFWTIPQVIDIVGPDGAKWWIQYSGPELRGEYNIRIDPSSSMPVNPETKKEDALEMIKAWAEMNQGAIAQGQPVPAELQRYFFSQYEGINVDELLSQQGVQPQMGGPNTPIPIPAAAQMLAQKQMGGAR